MTPSVFLEVIQEQERTMLFIAVIVFGAIRYAVAHKRFANAELAAASADVLPIIDA